jgi:hypothetical protein
VEKRADAELGARARAGDKAAFDALFERYQAMAQRVALGMVGSVGTAQELRLIGEGNGLGGRVLIELGADGERARTTIAAADAGG